MTSIKSDAIANAERRPIKIGASDAENRLKRPFGVWRNIRRAMVIGQLATHRVIERGPVGPFNIKRRRMVWQYNIGEHGLESPSAANQVYAFRRPRAPAMRVDKVLLADVMVDAIMPRLRVAK